MSRRRLSREFWITVLAIAGAVVLYVVAAHIHHAGARELGAAQTVRIVGIAGLRYFAMYDEFPRSMKDLDQAGLLTRVDDNGCDTLLLPGYGMQCQAAFYESVQLAFPRRDEEWDVRHGSIIVSGAARTMPLVTIRGMEDHAAVRSAEARIRSYLERLLRGESFERDHRAIEKWIREGRLD